jgi:hypothetical protein
MAKRRLPAESAGQEISDRLTASLSIGEKFIPKDLEPVAGGPARLVSVRFNDTNYKELKTLAASQGMALASWVKTVALWCAAMQRAGRFMVTEGGVIDQT